jgi:PAS domain S-box-containing protein
VARRDLVAAGQVHALYAKAVVPLLTVLINSAFVGYVFSGVIASSAVVPWVASLYAITFARFLLRRRYLAHVARPRNGPLPDYRLWETYFTLGSGMNGLAWGASAFMLYPREAIVLQVFLAFVLAGMTAGATASTATSLRAFSAFTIPALAPIALRFVSEGDRVHVAMGGMTALFGLAMSAIARGSGESFAASARLRFENEGLLEDFERAQVRLTELNEVLERRVEERTGDLILMLEQQKEAESNVRNQKEVLEKILDHAPVMVALYDTNGKVELINRELEQRLGWTLEDFRGGSQSIEQFAEPSNRPELRAHLLGEGSGFRDFRVATKAGGTLLTSWGNARLANGMIIGIGQDMTQRQQSQETLALTERMASLGTLAAGVAHEINNPLSFVLGNLEFVTASLQGAGEPAEDTNGRPRPDLGTRLGEAVEAMKEAHDGARRVAAIVADLRMFSRGSDDRSETVALIPLLETSTRLVANDLRQRATVVTEFGEVPPVRGTEGRLGHVFVSLLINASQSIAEGSAARNEVRLVTKTAQDGSAVVEVHDTGCGIPQDLLQRIFDPFFTTKPVGQGTGLGLSVCKGIVVALGGRLEVESRVRQGSVFRVVLPAATDPPGASAPPKAMIPTLGRARILIVDDEPMFVKVLQRFLHRAHDVDHEGAASRAIARVAGGEVFDVIFCDLMMPDVTGMEFYDQILRLAPHLASRIVFMTGGAFTEKSAEFLDRVTNQRLSKPFGKAELDAMLAKMLGGG